MNEPVGIRSIAMQIDLFDLEILVDPVEASTIHGTGTLVCGISQHPKRVSPRHESPNAALGSPFVGGTFKSDIGNVRKVGLAGS
jgi:hypothetical protein